MNVVIYGLGRWSDIAEKLIRAEHVLLGYSDSYAQIKEYKNKPFFHYSELYLLDYDFIILAVEDATICESIYNELLSGIEREKILFFCDWYRRCYKQKVDRALKNNNLFPESLVLGISHAVCGINPEILNGVNLAVRSQDLYYNLRTFEYYIRYANTSKIKNVILDMYDYNYFNYDVSMTKNCMNFYYTQGGYSEDEHNFSKNKSMDESFEIVKKNNRIHKLGDNEKIIWEKLFKEDFCKYNGYDEVYRNQISIDAALPSRKFISDIVTKRFDDTINENVSVFNNLCESVRKFLPDATLYVVLIPRYYYMELALEPHLSNWKIEFYSIIAETQRKWNFIFMDYKNEKSISRNCYFYNDVNHLNYIGANAFTALLKKTIT